MRKKLLLILPFFLTFFGFRPKNYCLRTESKTEIKCRGFHLSSASCKDIINEDVYKEFIEALLKADESERKVVPQFKITFNKKKSSLFSHYQLRTFASHVFSKRILLKPENGKLITRSLPYGFDKDLLEAVLAKS